ncbi:hypothetical protein [Phenylobacterium sp.]|uniref:hypothetical protein n=1 Tax=Phenylobacterium sp. TaxID=1871053 RepID=UPI002719668B|nr:hypothetical protein [Phenylobacterium sp.]MDO8800026.1 hypothetical protein [Phenylobacterium sp.]
MTFWREILIAALVASLALAGAFIKHQAGKIGDQRDALDKAASALRTAADAIRDRDKAATDKAALEASDATETATFYRGAARDAFKAGLASRPRCPGEPAGVRDDLRSLQAPGAFRASDVPGEPAKQDR